jgi:hypothetical protein
MLDRSPWKGKRNPPLTENSHQAKLVRPSSSSQALGRTDRTIRIGPSPRRTRYPASIPSADHAVAALSREGFMNAFEKYHRLQALQAQSHAARMKLLRKTNQSMGASHESSLPQLSAFE